MALLGLLCATTANATVLIYTNPLTSPFRDMEATIPVLQLTPAIKERPNKLPTTFHSRPT
jgi:hypothetical protein